MNTPPDSVTDEATRLRAQLAALQSQLDDVWHALGLSPSDPSQLIDVITDLREEARRSADAAAPSPAQLDKTHYQCERCGGMGQQPAGVYRMGTKKYDAPAGTCELCGGTGYLGPYAPSPAQAVGGEPDYKAAWERLKANIEGLAHISKVPECEATYYGLLSLMEQLAPRSAPEAGEGERPAMLRARARSSSGWHWFCIPENERYWLSARTGLGYKTCDFVDVDREHSDKELLALYDAETAPAPSPE